MKQTNEERLEVKSLIRSLNTDGDPDYAELRADVQRLLDPPPIPARARPGMDMSPSEYWLRVIGKKILAMKVNQGRGVISLGDRPYRFQPYRLRLGNEVFIYSDSPRLKGTRRERKRLIAYWLLDHTLKSGEFAQVRRCRSCPKYFATTRIDRVSCGPKCNVKYQNDQRQSSDNGKLDYFTEERWKRRERAVKKAQELKEQGRSPEYIKRTTGLSERVLQKEQRDHGLVALLELARKRGLVTPD